MPRVITVLQSASYAPKLARTTITARSRILGPAAALKAARAAPSPGTTFADLYLPRDTFEGYDTHSLNNIHPPCVVARDPNALFVLLKKNDPPPRFNDGNPLVIQDADRMLNTVQVVSTPTADTPGAGLVVHFGTGERYYFGAAAEGTQRIMNQRKIPMARINSVFVTGRVDSESIGGILGFILTVADVRTEYLKATTAINQKRKEAGKAPVDPRSGPLDIHGARNLVYALATARGFVFRKGMPMRPFEVVQPDLEPVRADAKPDWQDENLRVWQVPLVPDGWTPRQLSQQQVADQQVTQAVVANMFGSDWSLDRLYETMLHDVKLPAKVFVRDKKGHLQPYTGPLPNGDQSCENIPVLVRKPWPSATTRHLPPIPIKCAEDAVCYIAKGHAQRGKFKPDTAISLGVDKTSFKLLVAGKNVHGKDAMVVTPDMVMEPTIPGNGFAVIDIRYKNLVDSFLKRPEWSNEEIMDGVEAIYWILSDEVKDDQRLVDWMKEHPKPRHYLLARDLSPNYIAFESPAALILKMNEIDPDRFPVPVYSNEPKIPEALAAVAQVAQPGETLKLKPRLDFDKESIVPIMDIKAPVEDLRKDQAILDLRETARQKLADPAFIAEVEAAEKEMPTHGVEIVSLGTGSALPSKYRNVSATLIRVPGYGSYLLDCGENTLGQLRRLYGFEGADRIIEDLHAVYISHSHADHHLGTAAVLARRAQLAKQNPNLHPVAYIGTYSMIRWISEYNEVEDVGLPDHVSTLKIDLVPKGKSMQKLHPARCGEVALPTIEVCAVDHCHDALGVVLTWPSGLKIAYSGDCRPSADFAALGRGAHLLIHESTFDSELTGEAIAKKHSTMAEALEVGRQMQAKKILLTHFSQRYPKFPTVDETDQVVLFAFDLMTVKLNEFKKAQQFIPALQKLFADDASIKDDTASEVIEQELESLPVPVEQQQQPKGKDKRAGKKQAKQQQQQQQQQQEQQQQQQEPKKPQPMESRPKPELEKGKILPDGRKHSGESLAAKQARLGIQFPSYNKRKESPEEGGEHRRSSSSQERSGSREGKKVKVCESEEAAGETVLWGEGGKK